jgi:hypothetical protein
MNAAILINVGLNLKLTCIKFKMGNKKWEEIVKFAFPLMNISFALPYMLVHVCTVEEQLFNMTPYSMELTKT